MERNDSLRVLETLIDFFEAGNKQTDAVAKEILESDIEYKTKWAAEIERFKNSSGWTGLRSPEAELVAMALRSLLQKFKSSGTIEDTRDSE